MMCVLFPQYTHSGVKVDTGHDERPALLQCAWQLRLPIVPGSYEDPAFIQHGEPPYYWQVDWASRTNRMASLWFAFVGLSCTGSLLFRTKKTDELEQNTRYILSLLPFDSSRKSVVAVFQRAEMCVKFWGQHWNLTTYGRVRVLIWFKKRTYCISLWKYSSLALRIYFPLCIYLFSHSFIYLKLHSMSLNLTKS
jgi:hypothetical protein